MKVLLTATVQSHICQFHKPLIAVLKEAGYEIHVAARDNLAEKNGLKMENVNKVFDIPFCRSPFSAGNIAAYRQLKAVINENQYDLISCNTPVGGILTRLAARKSRKHGCRVIYTAHGFHFYKGASKKNWMLYYPLEKIFARLTDTLITITDEDYRLASKKFRCKVARIHGVGVSKERYHVIDEVTQQVNKLQMGYDSDSRLILCTGELNTNKDQTTIISAMPMILSKVPKAKLLIAGNGPMDEQLKMKAAELNIEDQVAFLGYRSDLEKFATIADMVVSCSYREGLPLNIVEAMLCGKPVVASINRGHKELIRPGENGYLVKPGSVGEFAEKVITILTDQEIASRFSCVGQEIAQEYSVDSVLQELKDIYLG